MIKTAWSLRFVAIRYAYQTCMANASLPCISSCLSYAVVEIMQNKRSITYLSYYIDANLLALKLLVITEMVIDNFAVFFVIAKVYTCLCKHRALLTLHVSVVRPFSLSNRKMEVRAAFIGALTTVQAGDRFVSTPTVRLFVVSVDYSAAHLWYAFCGGRVQRHGL